MVTGNTSQADDTTAFLRAVRSGNLERVIEFLDTDLDINTANSNGLNALHLASKDGHVEIVTELLKRGAKVDASTRKGNTALHIASLAGQAEVVSILIQYGAAVNIQSQNGFTPLYMAAQENQDEVVKLLLSNEANQSLATEDGFTPLAVAMQQGHDKVVSVLLENDSKGKVRLPALHIAAKKDDCKAADLLLQNDHKPDVTSKSGFTPLHIAAHYGNEEVARLLIKRGADVNHLAKHNISPLHVAAKWDKNNMVKVLLENSAQIDVKTRDGLTPLHCAARSGHEQVITTLLEHSAPISARTKSGLAPLHMASQGDHVDAVRVLLYHRAPVDELTIDYLTSLHVSAHCGHVRVAKLLLDRKADVNARALNGFTPLHIACKKNRIKVVELLLKHGASIESTTESGLTPLHVASFMGCMNIVIFLLQHEANPDVPTVRGETPLHLAARANQTDIIRILLRNGAKVDARAREQQTPLHIASRLGNIDIVMLLLQHGAAVDTATKDMYTALHIAAKEGQEEVTAILVENNASLKATTKNGFTPLHIAAKYGNVNVANILLQRSSKLDAQGKNDISPLHLACHYDHPNVVNLLLEKGASPHIVSQNGHTPLHIAARKNQMEIASTLLESGAEANAESKAGFTPLHLSAQKGHYDMTNLLIEHGADPNHKSKNGLSALHLCAQEDFIRVASILVKNGANVETETETGYRPIHVAAHFGHLSMIRFLLIHNADINVKTNQNYTPLHQAAQQGHAHVVTALLKGNASHKARTNDGLTALNIAQKLGYISVMEVLKGLSYDTLSPDNKNWDEKYKVIAPESLQETNFMSDSDDEGGSDALINEQPYRYLTADLMKSLRDDSLPIDVTRDDPVYRQVTKEGKQEFTQSNNYCLAENFDTDGFNLGRLHFRSFLVSFLVDARGGAMKGCRHSGVRIIVPPRRATMPIRVTCRLVKPSKVANPPPLMEGEALATRIIEMGPVGATFLGPVLIDIPHFASIRGKEREIIILRSENGETWKEHDNSVDNDETLLNTPHDPQMSATHSGRITRIITTDFPQYFATITRIKQEVHVIGAEGGILISSVANHVQAVFPPGALTKKIKVGLQAHVIPAELTAKLLGNCVAVSPIITIEPRRRKFHKPITLTIPVPQAANKGMINQYGGETPTLRLLCSIAGGTSESQWEDVTGSTPLTFMNDKVSFTTTVSARFWLMDCRNIGAVSRMATELYEESLYVPYIINFVIYSKRMDALEATLRILCMTDGKEGMHTLERQEEFVEIVKSRDVEALDGKDLYIEFSGNLVPVTKSGVQLKFTFKAFRQNRLSFHVKVKDPLLDPVARMLFMREPKVAKGEPPQQPICVLNIVLPETSTTIEVSKKVQDYEDSNIINQKIDSYESKYEMEGKEKIDELKEISPSESKFITDTLQKERTDAVTIHESLAQKAACPLESVDASFPSKLVGDEQDLSSTIEIERQTYKEKRKFWEDISKKRESYQRSESDVSRTSELTLNESDSQYMQNVATEDTEITSEIEKSGTMEDLNVPDISECSVAEKAHYFEEQIQKEITKVVPKLHQQISLKSEKEKLVKTKSSDKEKVDEDERYITELKEVKKVEKRKEISLEMKDQKDDGREVVKKSVCKQLSNKEDKDHMVSRDELFTHVVSEDIVTEKTDKPEKLKEDIEKVDSTYAQSELEEITTKKKEELRKLQKHAEQTIEYKEQASIHTAETPLETIQQVEELHVESPVLIKDQLVKSKVKDVTKQQPQVIDTIQKRHKEVTIISSEIHLAHTEETHKKDTGKTQLEIQTIPTDMGVQKESAEYVDKKQEDVKESVTEIKIVQELMKDAKKKQKEMEESVSEIQLVQEVIKDGKEKTKQVKETLTETKVEQEIVKDAKEKQKEVKEFVTEAKVEQKVIKDAKEKQKEVIESVTETKVEQEIVKDAKEKQKEVKEFVTEAKVEQKVVKDAKEKQKEVIESVTETKVKQEIVKDAKEKQKEVKESVIEAKVELEVVKDAKQKQKEVKESVTEIKVEQEMIKDAKEKQKEVKEAVTEVKVEQEVIKDAKEKQEKVTESVREVKVEQEVVKDAKEKQEEVKESVVGVTVVQEVVIDAKKKQEEVKKAVTEAKVEQEVIKDAEEKQEEVKKSVRKVKVEQEVVKDAKEKQKEVKEAVTEVKVEQEVIKDAKKKQEEVKKAITEAKVEQEVIKDAKEKQEEVKESVREVEVEQEVVKDAKEKQEKVKKSVIEAKVELEVVKDAKEKQKEVKESVGEIKMEQEVIKDAKEKQEEVKESVVEVKVVQKVVKEAKEKQEEVKEAKVEQEVIRDAKEKQEEVKVSVREIKMEEEVKKDAKEKQGEVKESVVEVIVEQEVVKDAKEKQKEAVTEAKVEQDVVKDEKKKEKEVKESVTETKVEQGVIKDVKEKQEEVRKSVIDAKVEQEVLKDGKKKEKDVEESVTEIGIKTEMIKDKKETEVHKSLTDVSAQGETVTDTKGKEEEVQDIVSEIRVEQVSLKDKEEKQRELQKPCTDVSVQRDIVEDVKSVHDSVAEISTRVEIPRDIKTKHKELIQSITDVSIQKERPGGSKIEKQDSIKEISSGRRIITEETTIIYKVQKDGTLVQEQVLKSVQIGGAADSVGALSGIPRDTNILETMTSKELFEIQSLDTVKPETISAADVNSEIQKFLEGKRKMELEPIEQGGSLEMLKKLPLIQETITKEMMGTTEVKKEDKETFVKEEPVIDIDIKHVKKESRIPISTIKVEKDKIQKEIKLKTSVELEQFPSKPEGMKDLGSELLDSISPTGKKKEFESRIPKRVVDVKTASEKPVQKDTHIKKESETYTITEKKLSEEVTSKLEEHLTTKRETQTFSKTFTDPQDAFKMFEDMDSIKKDFATVTSTVDHKSSSVLEKKEVISSEVCSGTDKIITLEEKERVEKKKSSESQMKKESPTETMEEKKSKHEELDKTAIQKMSMNLTDTQEVIDATASESRAETKKEETFKKLLDETGIMTREAGSSMLRESDAEVAIRIKKDVSEETSDKDGIQIIEEKTAEEGVFKPVTDFDSIEKIVHGESHKETKESFDVTQFVPSEKIRKAKVSLKEDIQIEQIGEQIPQIESLEERQRQKLKELEARTIAESLIKSIENEIEAKSTTDLKAELLNKGYFEKIMRDGIETDHEKLADDLTRKFESIMKKSVDKQTDQISTEQQGSKASMQEELYEKESTRDNISVSEDITKDEESSLHEKEESFPLSSSQIKLQDTNITLSPSSISEQIDFEETIDVDTNELEDILKSTTSPQFEKQQLDKYDQMELQRDFYSEESFPRDKIISEISDVRVLEVLEPGIESQSRQDSVDVPSLEMDEHKISEQTSRGIPSLQESADTDSFERIVQERDITISPSTVSEDTNVDSSLIQEHMSSMPSQKEHELVSTQRTDSFEFESPPIMSPKSKVQGLEIKSVDWMIGEEKIEISEVLQPSQIFNQELEAYESMQKKEGISSQDGSTDYDQESCTKSSEDVSMIESIKETCTDDERAITSAGKGSKFTVIPISEQDFESELVENKLDVSCQELVDTLQREYDAKTPIKEYVESIQLKIPDEQTVESEKREEEPLQVEEHIIGEHTDVIASTEVDTEKPSEQTGEEIIKSDVLLPCESLKESEDEQKIDEAVSRSEIKLKLEKVKSAIEGGKSAKEIVQEIMESDKIPHMDDVLKEWSEVYLSEVKPLSDAYIEYKRHIVKTTEKQDTAGKSVTVPSDTCALKIKKDDLPSVDLSAQYAITVLDQVVKKKIAEVKESLEAAKQDLIEELSENSETVIQIKDSPSEFQFKLQPESIPNDLPFLYKPSSHEHDAETTKGDSPIAKSEPLELIQSVSEDTTESKTTVEEFASSSIEEPTHTTKEEPPVIKTEKSDVETAITVHEDDEEERPSPVPVSRSGSDVDNKDESSSLVLPCPVLRRRHKPSRASKRVTSESEADVGSSSGDSSNYQSCDYEIGSGSRPSSSDIEALQSGGVLSATASEYETAMMSIEHSSSSKQTSQEYHTAATTMSSRESMKSLTSLSSGHLGSIDSTSELSETLVASEADVEKEEADEDFKGSFEEERTEQSDSSGSEIPIDELMDKIDNNVPYRMKRSSEMIFPQLEDSDGTLEVEYIEESTPKDAKGIDFATSTVTSTSGTLQSVDIMTSRISEDGIQSVCTQVISIQTAMDFDATHTEIESKASELETNEKDAETVLDTQMMEPNFLEQKYIATGPSNESSEISVQTSAPSMIQQASMSTSSTSGVSVSTVIEKEKSDRHSPDSDSFEIVDKPDIIDDFIVIEEVGREAEEYDSEGKSIRISSMSQVSSKNYDRDLENLITESKPEFQVVSSQPSKNNELFDFESQESPPQASNDDQYSQSYSDEEQYEGGKKWIEMQFHADARVYDIEYDRGPLEDIKEEEITDFEAGSSRFGSLGSHKESIGSVGSMRGSLGSTPDYDILASKKYFVKPSDHDNVSLSSLQEFEHLESAVAAENSKKAQCGSHDSINNGSLPKRYAASRSGHGDDVSLSSLKDFEGLEKACREAHLIELRAREEEDLLEHESPENKYKLESLSRTRVETTVVASFNPSTSGSDDYEKRIKEIDEIIRIAQSNVEKFDRQDDTTEDISQIEIMDVEKPGLQAPPQSASKQEEIKDIHLQKESDIMETSTDSLELEDNTDVKHHPLCRSSDSLEMKTTLDFPSLSSDSLNNVRDGKEVQSDMIGHASSFRRISSDSLDMPLLEQQNVDGHERTSENDQSDGVPSDNSLEQRLETTETDVRNDTMRTAPSTDT